MDPLRAQQIVQALLNGTSQRRVARRLGVSVKTVSRIAAKLQSDLDDDTQREIQHRKSAKRCPGCGWLIYVRPCLNCQLQQAHLAATSSKQQDALHRRETSHEIRRSA